MVFALKISVKEHAMAKPFTAPNKRETEKRYHSQRRFYDSALKAMEDRVKDAIEASGVHPVLKCRVKEFESYFSKLLRLLEKSTVESRPQPYPINDLIAFRVICPFLEDLKTVENVITSRFSVVEIERKGAERSFMEFGYDSIHLLVSIPDDIRESMPDLDVSICEIQIRTILQEAWAEVEHELVYKARFDPKDDPMRRKLAAMNANLSLSDLIFQDIRDYQRKFQEEISTRRDSFYEKVENEIDKRLFEDSDANAYGRKSEKAKQAEEGIELNGSESIDDLLLKGLRAHNQREYHIAANIYSEILVKEPPKVVSSLVHKHRGMVYFAQSRYEEAVQDFSKAMDLDPECYKAAYYRGVVRSVQQRYPQAIEDFNIVLHIHPCHFFGIFRRAQAFYHSGDYPQALSDCENALSLQPEDENAKRLKSMVMEKLALQENEIS
jgi:putative GTP pyrophosphokinase